MHVHCRSEFHYDKPVPERGPPRFEEPGLTGGNPVTDTLCTF